MAGNWANNLDMLSQAGVLPFDGPAYITGQTPRFIGQPGAIKPFAAGMPNPLLPEQPKIDEFKLDKTDSGVQNPLWKKVLFTAVLIGTLIAGGFAIKTLIKKGTKGLKQLFTFKKVSKTVTEGEKKIKGLYEKIADKVKNGKKPGFFSKTFSKIKKLFHK